VASFSGACSQLNRWPQVLADLPEQPPRRVTGRHREPRLAHADPDLRSDLQPQIRFPQQNRAGVGGHGAAVKAGYYLA
jgi:hypothetical protein